MQDLKLTPEQMSELNQMKEANEKLYNKITKKFYKEVKAYRGYGYYAIGSLICSDIFDLARQYEYQMLKLNIK
jgi:hypothetical protein